MNTLRNNIEFIRLYDATSTSYDELYRSEQYAKYDFLFYEKRIKPYGIVLDIGCGTGLLIEYFIENRFMKYLNKYICLEPSQGMIHRITDKGLCDIPKVLIIRGYGEYIPLPNNSVDVIFMITVWYNLLDPMMVLKEMGRVMKRTGYAIISFLKKIDFKRDLQILDRYFQVEALGCEEKECFYMLMSKNA